MLTALFEYKRWANEELLALGAESESKLNADDWRTFVRIVNHTHVVDRIFAGHLAGIEHGFAATNTEATPTLHELRQAVRASDAWYLDYVAGLTAEHLQQVIGFRFTDGETGRMSRHEILQHLIVHGAYHRGAAGRILVVQGITPPRDSLSVFWHRTEPERRN